MCPAGAQHDALQGLDASDVGDGRLDAAFENGRHED
jgi:hypothetical protein